MNQQRVQQIIDTFNLKPHPEGGYYAEEYRSDSAVASPIDSDLRPSLTHIYFLLTLGQVSRWHQVLHDEIWNIYEGDPLRILTFNEKGIKEKTIGEANSVARNDFFEIIRGGDYQAAETTGEYTLLGCSVAPGFEFRDFSYIEEQALKNRVVELGHDYAKFL